MNGDLISRSALMKEIESLQVSVTGLRAGRGILHEFMKQYRASVLKIVDEAPTAYDVDKVVEQLRYPDNFTIVCGRHYTTVDRAVEIVKAGGVE